MTSTLSACLADRVLPLTTPEGATMQLVEDDDWQRIVRVLDAAERRRQAKYRRMEEMHDTEEWQSADNEMERASWDEFAALDALTDHVRATPGLDGSVADGE